MRHVNKLTKTKTCLQYDKSFQRHSSHILRASSWFVIPRRSEVITYRSGRYSNPPPPLIGPTPNLKLPPPTPSVFNSQSTDTPIQPGTGTISRYLSNRKSTKERPPHRSTTPTGPLRLRTRASFTAPRHTANEALVLRHPNTHYGRR